MPRYARSARYILQARDITIKLHSLSRYALSTYSSGTHVPGTLRVWFCATYQVCVPCHIPKGLLPMQAWLQSRAFSVRDHVYGCCELPSIANYTTPRAHLNSCPCLLKAPMCTPELSEHTDQPVTYAVVHDEYVASIFETLDARLWEHRGGASTRLLEVRANSKACYKHSCF